MYVLYVHLYDYYIVLLQKNVNTIIFSLTFGKITYIHIIKFLSQNFNTDVVYMPTIVNIIAVHLFIYSQCNLFNRLHVIDRIGKIF